MDRDLGVSLDLGINNVTSCYLYSAHKLCQITWHSGLLVQLEEHIIVGICCLSQNLGTLSRYV